MSDPNVDHIAAMVGELEKLIAFANEAADFVLAAWLVQARERLISCHGQPFGHLRSV